VKTYNRVKGNAGEAIATSYLLKHDFEIIETNHISRFGEIDLIAKRDNTYHFVEVKYRTALGFGNGREAVTYSKQKTIRKIATEYLIKKKLFNNVDMSFDVIEIMGTLQDHQIEFLQACF